MGLHETSRGLGLRVYGLRGTEAAFWAGLAAWRFVCGHLEKELWDN